MSRIGIEKYLDQYIYFYDNEKEKRAGKIYGIENETLAVHSLRINSRGVSKMYHYRLKETEVIQIITEDEAIDFVHNKNNDQFNDDIKRRP